MDRVKLEVRSRTERGKDVRALRAAGEIPAVIYAAGSDATAVTVNARELRTAVTGPGGLYALIDVTVDGSKARPRSSRTCSSTRFATASFTLTSTRSRSTGRFRRS